MVLLTATSVLRPPSCWISGLSAGGISVTPHGISEDAEEPPLKTELVRQSLPRILTFADNFAISFFQLQGFTHKLTIDEAAAIGVDGLIIVDLPPEEDEELCLPAKRAGLSFIRLVTPTSDDARLPTVLAEASGFVYYVSITGITGTKSAAGASIADAYNRIKSVTNLPVVTGFGIRTPEAAGEAAALSDGAVVGSAVVDIIANNLSDDGSTHDEIVQKIAVFVGELAKGVAASQR